MANKSPVLIKATFLLDTDVFQHLSQWEKSLMDFYQSKNLEIERLTVLGTGDGDLFYTIKNMDKLDKPVDKPKQTPVQDKLKQMKKGIKK